jgi:putative ABC transport system permease protein
VRLTATGSLALRALARNGLRSLLTTLGIVIGVAAVILMQAMGEGASARISGEISSLGSNMMVVLPGGREHSGFNGGMRSAPMFTRGDVEAIRRECGSVRRASAVSSRPVRAIVDERNDNTSLVGVTADFFDIREWHAARGRDLDEEDVRQATKNCVVGHTVAAELYGDGDALGSELRLQDLNCRVVGVMAPKGVSALGQDQDDLVLIAHTTFSRRVTGDPHVGTIMASATSEASADAAKAEIEALLRQRRRISSGEVDDFNVRDMREVQQLLGSVTGVLTALLAGVAAISLVVGGIGIMNIMLVSVTERTREIGVRRAIGARARDILQQFIVEAMVLAALGGLIGVLVGISGAFVASRALKVPFVLPTTAAVVAFVVSVAIGVVFGAFPARKASRLRPIDALRFE